MIVKDEEAVIERCLTSAIPYIDSALIIDTGSSDRTREIAAGILMEDVVVERPWVDYGHNRAEALALAGEGYDGHLLIIDADMTVHGDLPLLIADSNNVEIRDGDHTHSLPIVLKAGHPWTYVGAVHEYLDSPEPFSKATTPLNGFWVEHHGDGARSRGGSRDTLEADRALLERAVALDPGDARSTFYLAQTLRWLGEFSQAAVLYERRAAMGGFPEEVWYARYQQGNCYLWLGDERAAVVLLDAWNLRPWRAEPLMALAREREACGRIHVGQMLREQAARIPYPAGDVLFIEGDAYPETADDESRVAA